LWSGEEWACCEGVHGVESILYHGMKVGD
jgi:hypothetical protein